MVIHFYLILTNEKKGTHVHVFSLFFIMLIFKNYEWCFFYEILILIKSKNINVLCFQIITNQTNYDLVFQ